MAIFEIFQLNIDTHNQTPATPEQKEVDFFQDIETSYTPAATESQAVSVKKVKNESGIALFEIVKQLWGSLYCSIQRSLSQTLIKTVALAMAYQNEW